MEWIEGVEHQIGQWGIVVSDGSSAANRWYPARELARRELPADSTSRRKAITDFANWTESSASEYLAIFGDSQSRGSKHRVFTFGADGITYLVPTSVMLKALFRPLNHLAPWLFHPMGLELASAPVTEGADFAAKLTLPAILAKPYQSACLHNIFSWIWAFPSARGMWESIYLHALQKTLAINLPIGTLSAVFRGKLAEGKTFAVTEMCVIQITTSESSNLLREEQTHVFRLRGKSTSNGKIPKLDDVERHLIEVLKYNRTPISDHEWRRIEPLLRPTKTSPFKHDPRLTFESALAKITSGTPWKHMAYSSGTWNEARTTYCRWKKRGEWANACDCLIRLREQTGKPSQVQSDE